MKSIYGIAAIAAGTLLAAQALHAADIARTYKGDFPIASVVTVPTGATTYYLSGIPAPVVNPNAPKGSVEAYGDTKTQTIGTLNAIKGILAEQKLTMGDVVSMHVYLVGDPAKDGKMDFAGMMEGYTQFFGTKDQPNKPSRTTVQVSSLVGPGQLVEIEVVAAHQ